MKNLQSVKKRIEEDEDFIYCPRLGNSLIKLMDKNTDGVDDERIKKVLVISQQELDDYFNGALQKLRRTLKVKE